VGNFQRSFREVSGAEQFDEQNSYEEAKGHSDPGRRHFQLPYLHLHLYDALTVEHSAPISHLHIWHWHYVCVCLVHENPLSYGWGLYKKKVDNVHTKTIKFSSFSINFPRLSPAPPRLIPLQINLSN
jgi:hypothetical protein